MRIVVIWIFPPVKMRASIYNLKIFTKWFYSSLIIYDFSKKLLIYLATMCYTKIYFTPHPNLPKGPFVLHSKRELTTSRLTAFYTTKNPAILKCLWRSLQKFAGISTGMWKYLPITAAKSTNMFAPLTFYNY